MVDAAVVINGLLSLGAPVVAADAVVGALLCLRWQLQLPPLCFSQQHGLCAFFSRRFSFQ